MKTHRLLLAALIIATGGAQQGAQAQLSGIERTELMKEDLSAPGREVVQVRVEFPPGVVAAWHSHPGEELVYVVEGLLEYQLDGRSPVTLKAGEVLFIPAGMPHAVRNVGQGVAAELATYLVEKGKPLIALGK